MQEVVTTERTVIGYAQPLSRLQVSWGSILAGAITTLAVAFILWMLSMAIIWTAMEPTIASVRGGLLAAWITGMVSVIAGAFFGGVIAGYLPGNPRRLITCAHGFLAWCTAFLVASLIQLAVIGGFARVTTDALVSTASAAVQTTGQAITGGPTNLEQRAQALLTMLGYTQPEVRAMVDAAKADLQSAVRGRGPLPDGARARGALDTFFAAAAVYTWLGFATWIIAAGMSVIGALAVLKRVRLVPQREQTRETIERAPSGVTLQPAQPHLR
jgi:hypothetical protein